METRDWFTADSEEVKANTANSMTQCSKFRIHSRLSNGTSGNYANLKYRVAQKRGHFLLRLVTLEILIRSASTLAQINAISFLTLRRNLFESTVENKVAPSRECQ